MSSAASGEPRWVALAGQVVPVAEVEAPLSGHRCVIYRVALSLLQRVREGGGPARETAGLKFLLRTGAQVILIEPEGARLRLPTRVRGRLSLAADAARETRLRLLYERLARGAPPAAVSAREERLQRGDWIGVAGWLDEEPHPLGAPAGYREPPRVPVLHALEIHGH